MRCKERCILLLSEPAVTQTVTYGWCERRTRQLQMGEASLLDVPAVFSFPLLVMVGLSVNYR